VVKKSIKHPPARRRALERRQLQQAANVPTDRPSEKVLTDLTMSESSRRRHAATVCGWCRGRIEVKTMGRIPKWCSASCRQRAWEQSRAAASGRSAVEVVERRVEIPLPAPPTQAVLRPAHRQWGALLRELAGQLNAGRIYDRDCRRRWTRFSRRMAATPISAAPVNAASSVTVKGVTAENAVSPQRARCHPLG